MEIMITKKDLLNCYRLYAKPEKPHLFFIFFAIICFVGYFVIFDDKPLMPIIFGLTGGVIGFTVHRYGYLTYKSNKIYSQQKGLHKPVNMEFSEEGIQTNTEGSNSLSLWKDFCKYKQNNSYILLFYSDALFLMLPKDQISTSEKELLNENLKKIRS